MSQSLDEFRQHREAMNEKILNAGNLDIKRFFALDTAVYREGALDVKTKELLGLVASAVLRCNDCILYHVIRCIEVGATDEEIHETLSIALIVGGSIVIPHMRFAFEKLEELRTKA
ncbi:carboxymuconolactone decarboxylase family protein [bacterium]|nr:carboxymuconolactone decarboxylase family protein [bacterium]